MQFDFDRHKMENSPRRLKNEDKKNTLSGRQEKKKGVVAFGKEPHPFRGIDLTADYSSPSRISRICTAALATEVPGPKMAATPAL